MATVAALKVGDGRDAAVLLRHDVDGFSRYERQNRSTTPLSRGTTGKGRLNSELPAVVTA